MKNFNTQQTIANLEHVMELLETAEATHHLSSQGYFDEAREELRAIKNDVGDLPDVPTLCNTFPTFPIDDTELKKAKKDVDDRKKILLPLAIGTALLMVIYFSSHVDFFNTLSVIGIMATAVIGFLYYGQKGIYDRKKKAYDDSVTAHDQSMQVFRNALARYESEKERAFASAKSYVVKYREGYQQSVRILNECDQKRKEAFAQFIAAMEELETLDVLPSEYYHLIPQMISLLKSGRADDQKEALNMAIEIERQEEVEAQRRAEEERRIAVLEKQAEEERRHNLQIERQQAEHDRAIERQAREDARRQENAARDAASEARRLADKANREARNAENRQRAAGVSKCASCANSKHCPSHIKNNGSGLTCGGYTPYK